LYTLPVKYQIIILIHTIKYIGRRLYKERETIKKGEDEPYYIGSIINLPSTKLMAF
jgi:hypothetical protein